MTTVLLDCQNSTVLRVCLQQWTSLSEQDKSSLFIHTISVQQHQNRCNCSFTAHLSARFLHSREPNRNEHRVDERVCAVKETRKQHLRRQQLLKFQRVL